MARVMDGGMEGGREGGREKRVGWERGRNEGRKGEGGKRELRLG